MRTYDGNIVPDNEVVFCDGILYVMSRVRYIEGDEEKTRYCLDGKSLDGEYDEPITLADIPKKYPCVFKVIFDYPLRGAVYNYKNHRDGEAWEEVGITKGYA